MKGRLTSHERSIRVGLNTIILTLHEKCEMPKFTRKDFLEALFDDYCREKGGFIMVKSSARPFVKTSTRFYPNVDGLAREQYSDEQHVYFGICPRERMKSDKEHIRYATALWAGLDVGPDGYSGKDKHFFNDRQALGALKSFPRPPSIIVKSGRGIHLYWLLEEVREIDDVEGFETVLKRISDYFQCHTQVGVDATLRLPETYNPKNQAQVFSTEITHLDPSCRYSLEDFDGLDLRIIVPSKRAPKPPPIPVIQPVRVRVIREEISESETLHEVAQAPQTEESGSVINATDAFFGSADPAPVQPLTSGDQPIPTSGEPVRLDEESIELLSKRLMEQFAEKMLPRIVDGVVEKLWERFGNAARNKQVD